MNNENFDDIKNLFEEETKLPENLSKEKIAAQLQKMPKKKQSNVKLFVRYVAAMAAAMIVFVGAYQFVEFDKIDLFSNDKANETVQDAAATDKAEQKADTVLSAEATDSKKEDNYKFKDEAELTAFFKKNFENDSGSIMKGNSYFTAAPESSASSSDSVNSERDFSDVNAPFQKTNTQVAGVDEADIIKNDGKYIYIISNNSLLTIVDGESMKAVFSKKIEGNTKERNLRIEEMYLNGDKLILLGEEGKDDFIENGICVEYSYEFYSMNMKTVVAVYDVSNRAEPKKLRRFIQDGSLNNSRLVGNFLYTVTDYCPNIEKTDEIKEKCYPTVDGKKSSLQNIYVTDKNSQNASYSVLSAFDISDLSKEVKSISVLSNSGLIYCTADTMYLFCNRNEMQGENMVQISHIYSFALNGQNLSFKAHGKISGNIDSQYNADEKDGVLRVATTDFRWNEDKNVSSLYTLDSELKILGKIEDIAKDEQIKSVRFLGGTAYVVTFKNTDPLFAIDLTDAKNPKILGELKLPGFSEYLHPVGENLLVGVGHDGNEENADFDTVKISLFDVSNKVEPKLLDCKVIKGAESEANYEPKAFFFNEEENEVGIPFRYFDEKDLYHAFLQLFKIENGKFAEVKTFNHPSENAHSPLFRGTYIGDNIYTVSAFSVAKFEKASGERTDILTYSKAKDEEIININGNEELTEITVQ